MKPVVFYVDDEPHNLTVFEAGMPDSWDVHTFDSPMKALEVMGNVYPAVIVSDQRMPGLNGVQFLELARKICPDSIRIIVTGYSDEDLIVESVRKAQIFDYLKKPWDLEALVGAVGRGVDLYAANSNAKKLQVELKAREVELVQQTNHLLKTSAELESARKREVEMRSELECWVPPFVLWALRDKSITFPIRKDIVGIAFDIVESSNIHDVLVRGRPVRSVIIQAFSECIIRHGGWRESHSGDSAYGHFGLFEESANPCDAAYSAAREFRVALRSISETNNFTVECGIALHIARDSSVDIHTVQLNTPRGIVTQKSFDTTSLEIDLLHRMEKHIHSLPGSNIVMSGEFLKELKYPPTRVVDLGFQKLKGQKRSAQLFIVPSDKVNDSDLERLKTIGTELKVA
ncbi:MAG: response regulator [Bdellovibrionia bacterium]